MIQSNTSMCSNEFSTIRFWNERIWPCHSRVMLIFLGQVRFRKMQKLEKVGKFKKYFKELLWLLLFPVLLKVQKGSMKYQRSTSLCTSRLIFWDGGSINLSTRDFSKTSNRDHQRSPKSFRQIRFFFCRGQIKTHIVCWRMNFVITRNGSRRNLTLVAVLTDILVDEWDSILLQLQARKFNLRSPNRTLLKNFPNRKFNRQRSMVTGAPRYSW